MKRSISSMFLFSFFITLSYFKSDLFYFVAYIWSLLQLFLLLTDTADMILVEVFIVPVMYRHILYLKTCVYKFLYSFSPCIVIIKKSTNRGYIPLVQVVNTSCNITHGIHHKALVGYFPFH